MVSSQSGAPFLGDSWQLTDSLSGTSSSVPSFSVSLQVVSLASLSLAATTAYPEVRVMIGPVRGTILCIRDIRWGVAREVVGDYGGMLGSW